MTAYTGYDPKLEPRDKLSAMCISLNCAAEFKDPDPRPTRGLERILRRDDQGRISSCSGFGGTGAAEVGFWLVNGYNRQFNPMWTYRRGQEVSGIRGDRGATIHGVTTAQRNVGLLPEDYNDDGTVDCAYRQDYKMKYPDNPKTGESAAEIASAFKIGYSVESHNFDDTLAFLRANQGGGHIGGDWGNWRPDRDGRITNWRGGGGGHARALIDWITIHGEIHIVEMNSHGTSWGRNGFGYWTRSAFNKMCQDRSTALLLISDLANPEPRGWKL